MDRWTFGVKKGEAAVYGVVCMFQCCNNATIIIFIQEFEGKFWAGLVTPLLNDAFELCPLFQGYYLAMTTG